MTAKETAAAILAASGLALGIALVIPDTETNEADLRAAGVKLDYAVYAEDNEGVKVYVAYVAESDGGTTLYKLDRSPCARRPAGVDSRDCLALESDGGTRDQGDENTMQDGDWIGVGCVRTACVVVAGREPETGL